MPPSQPSSATDPSTRDRLLEAGLELFAERGYAVSVRDICARAGSNVAAVNYHFGDKRRLYAEVLATGHQRAVAARPMPRLGDDPDHAEAVLAAWVRWFLDLLLVDAGPGPLGRLMARELADPTPALEELVRRSMVPIYRTLSEVVAALIPAAPQAAVNLAVQSVLGQCLVYRHAQPALRLLRRHEKSVAALFSSGSGRESRPDLDLLTRHIVTFSLAGLAAVRGSGQEPSP